MSAISLTRSFFTKFQIDANEGYKPSETSNLEITSEYKVELFEHKENKNQFQVIFTLNKIEAKAPLPYTIHVQMVGLFEADAEFINQKPRILEVNGGSILYSSIREQVLTFTGRSVYGSFTLPTIDLREGFLSSTEMETKEQK